MVIDVRLSEKDHKITMIDLTKKRIDQKIKVRGFSLLGKGKNCLICRSYEEALFIILNGKRPSSKELREMKKEIEQVLIYENPLLKRLEGGKFSKDPLLFVQISILSLGYLDHLSDVQIVAQSFISIANLINDFFGRKKVKPKENLNLVENLLYIIGKDYKDKKLVRNFTRMMIAWIEIGAGPPSVVATRVDSSSRTDVITAVSAGVGNATGLRHSSARIGAMKLIQKIFSLAKEKEIKINLENKQTKEELFEIMKKEVQSRLDRKELVSGFGHWIFKGLDNKCIDPRISVVEEAIKECYPNSDSYKIVLLLREIFRSGELIRKGEPFRLPPNSDIYWTAFLYEFLKDYGNNEQISQISSIFTILTRIGGLIAQDHEQRLDDSPVRCVGNWIKKL